MEALSNQLLVVTVLAYLVAMVCHAAEYAFGTRSHAQPAALRRELVTAGGPVHKSPAAALCALGRRRDAPRAPRARRAAAPPRGRPRGAPPLPSCSRVLASCRRWV